MTTLLRSVTFFLRSFPAHFCQNSKMKTLPSKQPRSRFPQRNSGVRRQRPVRTTTTLASRRLPDDPTVLETIEPNRRLVQAAAQRARRRTLRRHHQLDQDIPPERRRSVVCDGESLAYDEVSSTFDADRIRAAVEWFERAGHTAVAVVPAYLRGKVPNEYVLDNLFNSRRLVVVECERQGTAEVNVEFERQLLDKAVQEDAAVVSEREFRNVYNESGGFSDIVNNRVIGFCYFKSEIFIPVDPYGRSGPLLRQILQK